MPLKDELMVRMGKCLNTALISALILLLSPIKFYLIGDFNPIFQKPTSSNKSLSMSRHLVCPQQSKIYQAYFGHWYCAMRYLGENY